MSFKPLLACEFDAAKLKYDVLASPKLDGIRCVVIDGKLYSRSLKPIPSKHINDVLSQYDLDGLDGELIVGEPNAPDCYNRTTSHVMAHDKVFDFTFWVFDHHGLDLPYDQRLAAAHMKINRAGCSHVNFLPHSLIGNEEELLEYEAAALEDGFEGVMLRDPVGPYKHGRSTVKEGTLLKVKRFSDGEAVICGFEEQMKNTNEKTTNELGRGKRSSHQEGMVGKGTLGALIVRDCVTGVDFNIGTGLNDEVRQQIWADREGYMGRIVKYKSFAIGTVDKPRFPVYLGERAQEDMS